MNRAQLIDPDWARAGCPVRYLRAPRPEVDLAPRDLVTHCRDDKAPPPKPILGIGKRILRVLQEAGKPLRTTQISARDGELTDQQVASNIAHVLGRGEVSRKRVRRGYEYEITQKGRDFIA